MYQLSARAPEGRLLFRTDLEAQALWACVVPMFPGACDLVLMPTELWVALPNADHADRLTDAMRAYAVWRNRHRGEKGKVWRAHPKESVVTVWDRMCGSEIQVVVKPVQAGLCGEVLEWPWSLYRERVGFGFTGGTLPDSWPLAQHVLGSREAIVTPDGTGLPRGTLNAVELRAVIDAVCGVTRSFASEVLVRGRPRTLTLQTAWASYYCDVGMLAAAVGCTARTVRNTVAVVPACGSNFHDPELGACVAAVGDPRFSPLFVGDLRTTPAWLRTAYAAME